MAMWPPAEPVQRDHYYELQVHYHATNTEIRKAYLKLCLEHHLDKQLLPNASDAKFKRITDAYETLSNSNTRYVYDQQYLAIWNAWAKNAKRKDKQMRKRKRKRSVGCKRLKQTRDVVRRKHVNKQTKWRVSERRENELRKSEKRGKRSKVGKSKIDRLILKQERNERTKSEKKQLRDRLLRGSMPNNLQYDGANKGKQAQSQNTKAAEERLRQIQGKEANVRMRKIARLSREEAEKEESKQEQDEKEAIEQWQAAIEQAQERERVEQKNAMQQKKIAEDWQRANLYRQQEQNKDVKLNINDLRNDCDQSTEDINRRETAAAENFIQEIMRIRGDSKMEVLRDVVLITLEAVDREIVAQKGRKRKASSLHDDPARLPALVTELFAKMEANGDAPERFSFSKKRRVV
ncbi:hypothetical protein G6514_004351 [Epicoccum nigrum]|nr:hypothetical protein G6514_004351 [Epicoccum nigrum]